MPRSSGQKRSSNERPRGSVAPPKYCRDNQESEEEEDDGKLPAAAPMYFSQKYEHSVWPLIQAHLPCFIFRNNKFHLVKDDQRIVKTFDATSTDVLIEFMLQNGIPFADTLNPIAKEELTEEIASYHVPKCDLKNAQQGLNNFAQEDLKILSDQEIACILHEIGFIFYYPPTKGETPMPGNPELQRNWSRICPPGFSGALMFTSLEKVRVFVRTNEDLFNSGSSSLDSDNSGRIRRVRKSSEQIEQRKKMLSLRIWAATSPEPLPDFDWSKFGGTDGVGAASAAGSGDTVAGARKRKARTEETAAQTTANRHRKSSASANSGPAAAAAAAASSAQPGSRSQSNTSSRSNREAAPMAITAAGGARRSAIMSVLEMEAAPTPAPVPAATLAAATTTASASEPARVSLPAGRESDSAATATAPQQQPERRLIKRESGAESSDEEDVNVDLLTTEEIEVRNAALSARNEALKKFIRLKKENQDLMSELQAVGVDPSVQNDQQQE